VSLSRAPQPTPAPKPPSPEAGVGGVLALYTLGRIGLLALIAGLLLAAGTPLVIAVLVALVVALPLSLVLFRGLRTRLEVALAAARARRRAQRTALRAGLRGDAGDPDVEYAGTGDTATAGSPRVVEPDAATPPEPAGGASGDGPERQPDRGRDRPDQQQQDGVTQHADEPSPVRAAEHPPGHDDRER
jgi:type II secretory pathway pseudopilin PulG